jgi:hypothetical protein
MAEPFGCRLGSFTEAEAPKAAKVTRVDATSGAGTAPDGTTTRVGMADALGRHHSSVYTAPLL